jgi:hypothetical protein
MNPSTNEKKTHKKISNFLPKKRAQERKVKRKGIEQYLFRRAKNGSCGESIRCCHFIIVY